MGTLEERIALSDGDVPLVSVTPVQRTDPYGVARDRQIFDWVRTHHDDVVFLGDSFIDRWDTAGIASWRQKIVPLGAANFGVDSDHTEHLLWRLDHGELAGRPRVAVIEIGFNNLNRPPDYASHVGETVAGVDAVLSRIRTLSPGTKILLMGLIPVGVEPNDPLRAAIRDVNAQLARLATARGVKFLDISSIFLQPDGTRPRSERGQYGFHPSAEEFDSWANAIRGPVLRLLGRPLAPAVQSVQVVGLANTVNAIKVKFNEVVDAVSARNPANYTLSKVLSGPAPGKPQLSRLEAIQSIIYDPATRTTTIIPARALNALLPYQLTVNGTRPWGVRDVFGAFLDGTRDGYPGSSYVTAISERR